MSLQLGDYAEGDWFFIAVCGTCGREAILEPTAILSPPGPGYRSSFPRPGQ